MFKRSSPLLLLIIIPLLTSCRAGRTASSVNASDADAQAYIERFGSLAVSEMKRTGVPASITLAQGMIESDFGRSTLAMQGNNHFGIKCHDDWTGPAIRHNDERRNECFRKYSRPEDSFYDHSDFLKSESRYKELFNLSQTDYKGWAHGLKKAGYATNPDYAGMLIRKIEENNLYYFDTGKLPAPESKNIVPEEKTMNESAPSSSQGDQQKVNNGNAAVPARVSRVMENNRIQYIVVKDGETREMIENEFQLLKWELIKYNELDASFSPVAGQILYLQPKRDKAEPGKEAHVVRAGDTMYIISQIYGVKMKKLYEYNRMNEGAEPAPGEEIWLRGMKPVN
ncbi:MAG: glucosaminidase domain-containing protein [Bacteroidales bacterium]